MEEKKPYRSLEEIQAEEKKFVDEHPIQAWFKDIYYTVRRFFINSWYNRRWIKWGWQRARKGYSDHDVWSFDYYIAKVMVGGLKQLREHHMGIPADLVGPNGEGHEEGDKKWKGILDEIIWTFETSIKVVDSDYWLVEDGRRRRKALRTQDGKHGVHVMTKEETERYKKGWKLFEKYFFSLWD